MGDYPENRQELTGLARDMKKPMVDAMGFFMGMYGPHSDRHRRARCCEYGYHPHIR